LPGNDPIAVSLASQGTTVMSPEGLSTTRWREVSRRRSPERGFFRCAWTGEAAICARSPGSLACKKFSPLLLGGSAMYYVAVGVLGFLGIAAACAFAWETGQKRRVRESRAWPPTDDRLQGFVRTYEWN
jgi:hypothetical protein